MTRLPAREWLAPWAVKLVGVHDQLWQKTRQKGTVNKWAEITFLAIDIGYIKTQDALVFGGIVATVPINRSRRNVAKNNKELISFEEAMEKLSRDDRFRATTYAMNTLLVQKGVYSPEEFEFQFRQFAQK